MKTVLNVIVVIMVIATILSMVIDGWNIWKLNCLTWVGNYALLLNTKDKKR